VQVQVLASPTPSCSNAKPDLNLGEARISGMASVRWSLLVSAFSAPLVTPIVWHWWIALSYGDIAFRAAVVATGGRNSLESQCYCHTLCLHPHQPVHASATALDTMDLGEIYRGLIFWACIGLHMVVSCCGMCLLVV
jgi:hypothetical protein